MDGCCFSEMSAALCACCRRTDRDEVHPRGTVWAGGSSIVCIATALALGSCVCICIVFG
jgi:hypothetical protein